MCFVEIPHPIGMLPKEEVWAKVDKAFDSIINAATKWIPAQTAGDAQEKPYPARVITYTGTYSDVNTLFRKRNWSLSLPIVPPTAEKVQAMLKGTQKDPSEILWIVPPRQGVLTVELVAAIGVMAGAQPEHMPLLLAAVEAMKHPASAWRGTTTTTAPTEPMLIISGPIIEKFKLNKGTGTSGPMNPVTNALGYFVNLVGDVVGGSIPPTLDKSTHGTSADFVATVFVENLENDPWKADGGIAVSQGFTPQDSVLTLAVCYPPGTNIDHASVRSTDLLNTFSAGIAATNSGVCSCFADVFSSDMSNKNCCKDIIIIFAPEHAATIAKDFPTRRSAAEYIAKNAVMPFKSYAPVGYCVPPKDFGPYNSDTLLPRFKHPDSIRMVVSGGAGKQSQFWVPFPQVLHPVSVKIEN